MYFKNMITALKFRLKYYFGTKCNQSYNYYIILNEMDT